MIIDNLKVELYIALIAALLGTSVTIDEVDRKTLNGMQRLIREFIKIFKDDIKLDQDQLLNNGIFSIRIDYRR